MKEKRKVSKRNGDCPFPPSIDVFWVWKNPQVSDKHHPDRRIITTIEWPTKYGAGTWYQWCTSSVGHIGEKCVFCGQKRIEKNED